MNRQISVTTIGIASTLWLALALGCGSSTPTPAEHRTAATPVEREEPARAVEPEKAGEAEHRHDGTDEGHADHDQAEDKPDESSPEALLAAERQAYERAKPVFEKYCAKCHAGSKNSPLKRRALPHFNMNTYPFGGHHASEIAHEIREVLGATGKEPTMPQNNPGAVKGEELERILAWADAFERAKEAGLHDQGKANEHDHGGHSH